MKLTAVARKRVDRLRWYALMNSTMPTTIMNVLSLSSCERAENWFGERNFHRGARHQNSSHYG